MIKEVLLGWRYWITLGLMEVSGVEVYNSMTPNPQIIIKPPVLSQVSFPKKVNLDYSGRLSNFSRRVSMKGVEQ